MMRRFKQPFLLGAGMMLLSACGATFDYDRLESIEITGTTFPDHLARAYQEFSLFEARHMNDWADGAHFGRKALAVLNGEHVAPENIDNWWIRKEYRGRLSQERLRLVSLLEPDVLRQSPEAAARAQAGFDCWVEQQEENWQQEHIEACREQYFSATARLERQLGFIEADPEAPKVTSVVQTGIPFPRARADRQVLLSFDFDSAAIPATGLLKISEIVEMYEQGAPVTIVVSGHTDRAGPEPYNERLSRQRAESVRKKLIEAGVPVQLITATSHGERRPLLATENGVREPLNRRVEITLGRAKSL